MSQALPLLPETAPFASEQIDKLNAVMASTNPEQRSWLSGFLAGYQAASSPAAQQAPAAAPAAKRPLTILYATESGNSEEVAANAKKMAARLGFTAKLVDMADTTPADMAKVENLLVVASTWGEGDPPERAAAFYQALMADDAPRFQGTRFGVLALGDSSYASFCETGRRIDARLQELGAERVWDRVDCDVDYDDPAKTWVEGALARLDELTGRPQPEGSVIHVDFHGSTQAYSKTNPFEAEITEIVNLNSSRSAKETLHLELSLEGSGLTYQPGDALGIIPLNAAAMVEEILQATGLDGDELVDGEPLREVLSERYDITGLTRPVVENYARIVQHPELQVLVEGDGLADYLAGREIIDLLVAYPGKITARELTGLLRKLPPRLYSIASSAKAHPDEAHLLISAVRYGTHGRARKGVASTFVADELKAGDRVKVYVKPNKYFRLPENPDAPVVMVGPGTGVAPFRAFLEERQATGAVGKNWLFFGDRNYLHDFLYQLDWQELKEAGTLSRIDLAFSRDQPEKIYVQDRMWARRDDLFAWLEEGAYLYVCGDEKQMAKDVELTLHRIVQEAGGLSEDDAKAYIARLKKDGRYQRDVY